MLVFCWKSFVFYHRCQSFWHRVHEVLTQLTGNFCAPYRFDSTFQLIQGRAVAFWYSLFYQKPKIFNWIEVRGISRPIQKANIVGLKPFHNRACFMAWCRVLLEYIALMDIHECQEPSFKNVSVLFSIHLFAFLKKECTTSKSGKTCPHHNRLAMSHLLDR